MTSTDEYRFKGPESLGELRDLQQKENFDYFKKKLELEHETKKFGSVTKKCAKKNHQGLTSVIFRYI